MDPCKIPGWKKTYTLQNTCIKCFKLVCSCNFETYWIHMKKWFVLITFLINLTMILQEKLTHENPMSPSSTWNPVDSIGVLLASPLFWLQPYVHCWHTIWIRDRKPSWGPEVGEGGGWREDGVTLLPKKKMGEKSFSWGGWDECFAKWQGLMDCFYTTPQTKRLKQMAVFVFVCFCLIYIHDMYFIFMSNICMCINMYIYIYILIIFIAHSIFVDAMRIGRKHHEGIEEYQ